MGSVPVCSSLCVWIISLSSPLGLFHLTLACIRRSVVTLLTMTAVAAVHDVPLAQYELPVRGSERRRETATPEKAESCFGEMFNRVAFWSLLFFCTFLFLSQTLKCTFRPFRWGITGSLAKHRNALQRKGREKLRVALGFRGWEDTTTTTRLFFFRCKTTAEFRLGVRLSLCTCSSECLLANRPFQSQTHLPYSNVAYAERNTSFQNKYEPQRHETLMWKTFVILGSYQSNQSERMMGHYLHDQDTIFNLWSVFVCVCVCVPGGWVRGASPKYEHSQSH